ncbi:hypothetical protein LAZ67_13003112 [Cordylochernes scorpioides]|uniref:Uncharacterized protein n=1 Tax=Cordylochernes scorpioides TaxID=51811 RepID=A0ABY6L9U7_9ARAC|nr:hypothetical protein LAZ67_13003112 [Cordylochernes scorpioides]
MVDVLPDLSCELEQVLGPSGDVCMEELSADDLIHILESPQDVCMPGELYHLSPLDIEQVLGIPEQGGLDNAPTVDDLTLSRILEGGISFFETDLLRRKGVYPYEYMTDSSKFSETSLPPIEYFSSKLLNESCSNESYAFAQQIAIIYTDGVCVNLFQTGRFRWLTSEECNQIDILALQDDSPIGYIFVVDLCYPEHPPRFAQ